MNAIKHYVIVNAPTEKLNAALTRIEGLASWWTANASGSPEVGNIIEFSFSENDHNKMKIIHLDKNQKVEWGV